MNSCGSTDYVRSASHEFTRALSTSLASITDGHLLTALDGREVHYAFVNETNELRYDTTPFEGGSGTLELGGGRVRGVRRQRGAR